MEGFDYGAAAAVVADLIASDPTTATFYSASGTWQVTGRLAVAGSRTFGRTGQSFNLMGSELTGSQLYVLLVPAGTQMPAPADEVRTDKQGVQQRFNVVQCLPVPWKIDIVLDEVR